MKQNLKVLEYKQNLNLLCFPITPVLNIKDLMEYVPVGGAQEYTGLF